MTFAEVIVGEAHNSKSGTHTADTAAISTFSKGNGTDVHNPNVGRSTARKRRGRCSKKRRLLQKAKQTTATNATAADVAITPAKTIRKHPLTTPPQPTPPLKKRRMASDPIRSATPPTSDTPSKVAPPVDDQPLLPAASPSPPVSAGAAEDAAANGYLLFRRLMGATLPKNSLPDAWNNLTRDTKSEYNKRAAAGRAAVGQQTDPSTKNKPGATKNGAESKGGASCKIRPLVQWVLAPAWHLCANHCLRFCANVCVCVLCVCVYRCQWGTCVSMCLHASCAPRFVAQRQDIPQRMRLCVCVCRCLRKHVSMHLLQHELLHTRCGTDLMVCPPSSGTTSGAA